MKGMLLNGVLRVLKPSHSIKYVFQNLYLHLHFKGRFGRFKVYIIVLWVQFSISDFILETDYLPQNLVIITV